MSVNEEIRHKIADVAANKLSVWAFEQWIEPLSWSMHRDLSASDIQFIGSIQDLFARFDFENADEFELRHQLSLLGNKIVISDPIDVPNEQPVAPVLWRFSANSVPVEWSTQYALAA